MSHEVHKCWRGWPQSGMNIIEIRSVWDTISSYFILDLQTTEHEALLSEQVLVQTRWWSDTVQSHNIITTSAGLQLVLAELARSGSKGSSLWESNLLKPSFSLACRAKPWQLPHEPLLAYLTRHSRPKKKSGTSSLHYVYIYIYITASARQSYKEENWPRHLAGMSQIAKRAWQTMRSPNHCCTRPW